MGQCTFRRTDNNSGGICSREGSVYSERQRCFVLMVKERKSRFYIARRCIIMLICWHKYG
ncbi:hypothetical protein Lalb_Chr05g0212131 [Lupinus albus]|uniref:Uncharacterized protein n=1 Tax=Lupinus albus TaxID=3870 RepID=A0A6A4QI78_LUPAL|nr:hypothetical protein Lalb_Chr05g0212131 [Lupinus albus]